MLTRLSIRNIVLIEALDLDFGSGLGVLTGETGAGKSILLDALGLVLGNRADSGLCTCSNVPVDWNKSGRAYLAVDLSCLLHYKLQIATRFATTWMRCQYCDP